HDHRRDRNPLVATAFTPYVVVVGDVRAAGKLEHLAAARGNPMPAIGFRPRERTFLLQFVCDGDKFVAIVRGVAIEVIDRTGSGCIGRLAAHIEAPLTRTLPLAPFMDRYRTAPPLTPMTWPVT